MMNILKDFTLFELSVEIIFVLSILFVFAVLSFTPHDHWGKVHKPHWYDIFLHPKH